MQNLIGQLRALGRVKLLALAGVGAALAALLLVLALRANAPAMAVLYSELEQRDAGAVVAALERARVPFRLAAGGSQVLVPAEDVARLRLSLAREGLPAGGAIGNEIFDRGEGLTTTPFQQEMNRLRALEGELARSIRALAGVRNARVHLVLPRREAFSRERAEAQASVLLTMQGAHRLDREGTQAVLHLVVAGVPGLRAQNVSIVDSRGELLARGGQAIGPAAAAATQEEPRRAHEARLARGVEEMLERVLGPGRVRAEVAVEMDADRVEIREERFDPENQVARSQQSTTESSRGAEPANVSVGGNLPGAEAPPGGGGPQENRQEETTNFEIGRTLRNVLREAPVLKRISVAVLVDGVTEAGEGGAPRVRERTAEEVARIAALVRSAVGFDERRGDRVEVVSMRFAEPAFAPPAPGPLGLDIPQALLAKLMETAILAGVAVLALLLLGRPLVKRLSLALAPQPALAGAGAGTAEAALAGTGPGPAAPPAIAYAPVPDWQPGQALPAGAVAGPGGVAMMPIHAPPPGMPMPPLPPGAVPAAAMPAPAAAAAAPSMVEVANVSGAVNASTLQRVARLVEENPDEALAVVRGWLAPEEDR
ncbi:flagellar basal-body MS-ring/collar protein FliF [Roseococcus sp. DSY-14]|uniref:flagellar basal-body MS-ring/collar protein FliF n=1 Tax=Roseococcus sp. DSY-14 TaxID=3369650 RepID=UPI00387AE118